MPGRHHQLISPAAFEAALRRDRLFVVIALVAITALSLAYTVWLATGYDMSAMMTPEYAPWSATHFAFMFAMWVVMMIGMMTPSVAPMVLLYAAIARQQVVRGRAFASAGWFVAGYLLSWVAFSAVATLLQWLLEWQALVTPMMAGTGATVGGALLIAAGSYQWLPIKQACLIECRAPLSFVQRHGGFQPSARGSVTLGARHGLYCIGCCWAVMALLFAFGVMNLVWIGGLMAFVLLEKLLPFQLAFSRIAGTAAIISGVLMLVV